jgi:hypothetical protein
MKLVSHGVSEMKYSLILGIGLAICGIASLLSYMFGYIGFLVVYDIVLVIAIVFRRKFSFHHSRHSFSWWASLGLLTMILHGFLLPSVTASR